MKKKDQDDRGSWGKLQNSRPTIGYLAFGIDDHIADGIWRGIVDAAQEQDVNLISFVGQRLRDPNGFLAQANIVYDLVNPEQIDGLIVWTSTISTYLNTQESLSFIERYHPLPTISLGTDIEGIPSILVESYQGLQELMNHLIEEHGYRRLAFISGPENHPYAQARYRAYTDALAKYNLPFDPNLVTPPADWEHSTGYEMIHLLLDQRNLQPHLDLDAVVTASDLFALGALEALQERGINVPKDIGVVGFNDSLEGRATTPPLTSVRGAFYQQGERALEMVLAVLTGEPVPEQVVLPSQLVVRQSCGCADAAVTQAKIKQVKTYNVHSTPESRPEIDSKLSQEKLLAEIKQATIQTSIENLSIDWAEQLVQAFLVDIDGQTTDSFLTTLEGILDQLITAGIDAFIWQNVLSVLRRYALAYFDHETLLRAENLVQQARVLIGEIAQRTLLRQEIREKEYTQTLRRIAQALIATFDLDRLRDVLIQEFPALDIPGCYLCLYENLQAPTEMAQLILAYHHSRQNELESQGNRFPSRQLVPSGMLAREKRYSMVVKALYFEDMQLGFVLFEMGPTDGATYATLRGQISSALQGALLLQERQRAEAALELAYADVEQQVEERTQALQQEIAERKRAEAELQRYQEHLEELVSDRTRALEEAQAELMRQERLSALGQLTATVAHEIRNPLGTVRNSVFSIGNAIERSQLDRVELALKRAERNITRCDNIITELLDYTRTPELKLQPICLDEWLQRILAEQTIPENIILSVDLAKDVEISLDPERFRRTIINLVDNACQAMQEMAALDGPEQILYIQSEIGEKQVQISITDTGPGIPPEVMPHIFEPLYSTKSFGVGLGLPIVETIVKQHGGRIEINSEAGRGTQVVLWLPVVDDSQ
jgi:signal transduction histidine kinase/DNA-binding LacI/PurR family transcriptional regulator